MGIQARVTLPVGVPAAPQETQYTADGGPDEGGLQDAHKDPVAPPGDKNDLVLHEGGK